MLPVKSREEFWEEFKMMNVTLTAADVIKMMATTGNKITAADLVNNKEYQEELTKATAHNNKWDTIKTAYETAGITDADTLEAITNVAAQGPRVDITALQKKYIDMMQAQEDAKAKAEQVKCLETGMEILKEMGLITPTEPQAISAPAPAPAASVSDPAESRMTMAERKAIIRDMVGTGSGTNQFRRHRSTTAQANAARAKIEEWRSKGYISGTQKAELRAEVNAAAWLGHCGVTATR